MKPGWKAKVLAIKPRFYLWDNDARRLVDNTFDEMHKQGDLKSTINPTPFSFLVFVIWKSNSDGKRKGHTIVDICKVNDLVLFDFYPLPL